MNSSDHLYKRHILTILFLLFLIYFSSSSNTETYVLLGKNGSTFSAQDTFGKFKK